MNYTFYWRDGTREVLKGSTIQNALGKAGYSRTEQKGIEIVVNGIDTSIKRVGTKWIKIKRRKSQ